MDKSYNHEQYEEKIYKLWEKSGAFMPQKGADSSGKQEKNIGHARFVAIEDILVRYHRMKGEPTLWLPGADHAGIETQYVFEKKLAKEGKSRFDYDQDTLYKMIWDYVMKYRGNMENQLRALGASCDWSRNKFTLDPDITKIVHKTFKKLYDDGLVYRGERIINYCPRCGTAFSQLEVKHIEQDDKFYYLNYGSLTIATTRPETIFADVAIAVNPKDDRYKKLIGKSAMLPLVNRELPIIADSLVDPEFGTGALKVTPGHDATDFEIGQKHNLPRIAVIDESGKMINTPEKYIGMRTKKARGVVVNDLKEAGKIKKIENIHHTVGVCYRDQGLIEPMLSKQWFVKVESLSKNAFTAIKNGKVKFAAKRYEKIAKHWLKNLKDWNISRQIVWGIRIPAFRCQKCLEWTITEGKAPEKCAFCSHTKLIQDTDTFDTWFSSGQWPFATLQTGKSGDFERFYPTSVMETAYDILPFWVIRMIMLGLVRDKEGQKISKSKGNVIDPIDMTKKYGADALRMAVVWGALIENDMSLSEDNVRGQRNFANKIWNIARFVLSQPSGKRKKRNEDDKDLRKTSKRVTRLMEKYRLNEAAEEIYDFIWKRFANDYLEKTKDRREGAQKTLELVLQESLKLLHPFMPFVTEAIWQEGKERFDSPILITASDSFRQSIPHNQARSILLAAHLQKAYSLWFSVPDIQKPALL
jgi:valyl-tRNA synthetase